jgi:translation elongation factor P/translation initiation factor 5A
MKKSSKHYSLIIALLLLAIVTGYMVGRKDIPGDIDDYYLEAPEEAEEMTFDEVIPLADAPAAPGSLMPMASGEVVYKGASGSAEVTMDASNAADGYVMIKYQGPQAKLKVIIAGSSSVKYTYNLGSDGSFVTYPLSDGNGQYSVGVYKNVSGTKYSLLFSQKIDVELKDEFAPFLRPNQYVNYTEDSQVVEKAAELTEGTSDELEKIEKIYTYVVTNFSYDYEKAKTVQSGYLPVVDEILATKKGICFDYAAVMTAMLRSRGIPTKLVVGYAGDVYHAWISSYTEEYGWINGVIYFDGKVWKLMDPTFASTGKSSAAIMKYISNEKNYQARYLY